MVWKSGRQGLPDRPGKAAGAFKPFLSGKTGAVRERRVGRTVRLGRAQGGERARATLLHNVHFLALPFSSLPVSPYPSVSPSGTPPAFRGGQAVLSGADILQSFLRRDAA